MSRSMVSAALAWLVLAPACAVDDEETIGTAEEAALTNNALTANALTANALTNNALTANALSPNAMTPASRAAITDPGPDGDLARQLLRYEVSCAFDAGQSFAFVWRDDSGVVHRESYPGSLGLAPEWATGPLGVAGQEWVSACLAARVNAFGRTVPLSARGEHPALATTAAERAQYPVREAVFFGNLFDGSPAVYACNDPTTTPFAVLRSRLCGQPNLLSSFDCGPIVVLGPCYDVLGLVHIGPCSAEDPIDRDLYRCAPWPGAPETRSLTTFLRGL